MRAQAAVGLAAAAARTLMDFQHAGQHGGIRRGRRPERQGQQQVGGGHGARFRSDRGHAQRRIVPARAWRETVAVARLQRLPGLLNGASYDAILIGIGGNDMLRGVSATATRDNLVELIRQARAHTPHVAVLATPSPDAMRAVVGSLSDAPFYEEVAKAQQALLVANVYSSVLSDSSLRSDRIHANARGYEKVAQLLAEQLKAAGWR